MTWLCVTRYTNKTWENWWKNLLNYRELLTGSNRKWTLISIVYFLLECMIDQSMFKVPKNSLCLMLRNLSFMKNNMHFKGQELFGPFVIVCRNSPTQCFSRDRCGPMYLLFLKSRSAKTFFSFSIFWNFTEFKAQECLKWKI